MVVVLFRPILEEKITNFQQIMFNQSNLIEENNYLEVELMFLRYKINYSKGIQRVYKDKQNVKKYSTQYIVLYKWTGRHPVPFGCALQVKL